MRILYATHAFFPESQGGVERLSLNLALAMRHAGHGVGVATYSCNPGPFEGKRYGIPYRNYFYKGIPVTALEYQASWAKNLFLDSEPNLCLCADEIVSGMNYDLLHATSPMCGSSFILAAIRAKIPYLITIPSYLHFCYRTKLLNPLHEVYGGQQAGEACLKAVSLPKLTGINLSRRTSMEKLVLSHASTIVSPSAFLASAVRKEHPGIKIRVIPHGGAHADAAPNGRRYFTNSSLTFGYMGRLIPVKGVDVLIKAFRKIKNPNCRLKVYGLAERRHALELLKLAHGDRRITFCGSYSSQEEISGFLQNIDVLCFPSLWLESYGIVVEEALAARVPVLASRIGAVPERVKDGVNGFLFRPGNVEELHSAMDRIVDNPALLNTLKNNIASFTTIEEEAAQYEGLYSNIANAKLPA